MNILSTPACQVLDALPLVQAGLIEFEIIPLVPYPTYARLIGVPIEG